MKYKTLLVAAVLVAQAVALFFLSRGCREEDSGLLRNLAETRKSFLDMEKGEPSDNAQRPRKSNLQKYVIDPDRDPATANYAVRNPDFNVRSLRGNAVLRWEYRPGPPQAATARPPG